MLTISSNIFFSSMKTTPNNILIIFPFFKYNELLTVAGTKTGFGDDFQLRIL